MLQGTGQHSPTAKAAGLCRALLTLWPALLRFVTVPGVEPANNAAECAIRPAVLWRKQSLGTQTAAGNQFVARMLSAARVPACGCCRQQRRPLLDYLTAVCTAAHRGQPIPPLLPPWSRTGSTPVNGYYRHVSDHRGHYPGDVHGIAG